MRVQGLSQGVPESIPLRRWSGDDSVGGGGLRTWWVGGPNLLGGSIVCLYCVGGMGTCGGSLRVEVLLVPLSSLSLARSSVVMVLVVTSLIILPDIEEMEAKSCAMGSG